jgi:hypothetical protein
MYWITQHLDTLIAAIATSAAAIFAYRSARMSEIANKAQFSPLLIPSDITYISADDHLENSKPNESSFYLNIQNRSEFSNAFAKNIVISINGDVWWELGTLDSGGNVMPQKRGVLKEQVLSKELVIAYEDILGNKFQTRCTLSNKIEKQSEIHSSATMIRFDWKYIQK